MPNDILKNFGENIHKKLGFIPTSNSTKPTYIANGVFRECTGETCDMDNIQQWILSDYKNDKKAVATTEILAKYADKFVNGENENIENIKVFRYLLSQIFNPDSTVFPSIGECAFNITSHWFIRKYARSEGRIGKFISGILKKEINSKKSPALSLITEALKQDKDDFTKLIKPILTNTESTTRPNREVNQELGLQEDENWDELKQIIREGFDRLAENLYSIGEYKNPLVVLERMVNFSVYAVYFYHINISKVNTLNDYIKLTPIFIDSCSDLDSVRKASEQTYILAKKSVEDYYIQELESILNSIVTNNTTDCEKWIRDNSYNVKTETSNEIRNALSNYYSIFLIETPTKPIYALARSLQFCLYTFTYKNNTPSDFCRVLGVRGGLIGPRGNRAFVKRYILNNFTLETITLSLVQSSNLKDGIDLKKFCSLLLNKYCIMIGSDPELEYKLLEETNITQSTPGDLRGDMVINYSALADMFISLGLATWNMGAIYQKRRDRIQAQDVPERGKGWKLAWRYG